MAIRKSRKPIFGKFINDADYVVKPIVDGIKVCCPFYRRWFQMLNRAYNPKYHKNKPSCADVEVCKEWHSFMNFRKWMVTQNWKDKHLDKDLLFPNNKVYSPDTCIFISDELNTLLVHGGPKSKLPRGITKRRNKYIARYLDKYIGAYFTLEESIKQYNNSRYLHLIELSKQQSCDRIKAGLLRHASLLKNDT